MIRNFCAVTLAAALLLVFANDANAVIYTSNGDFAVVSDQDGVAPISDIEIISGSGATGRIYTNQVSGGAPFALGSEIRTVSAYRLDAATDGIQHSGIEFADGDKAVIVSAIRGSITDVGASGLRTATFTEGRAFVVKIGASDFDARDPDSWDSGTVVGEFALKPQEAVRPSAVGANVNFEAFQTNQSSVNTQTPQQTQGVFLFREDSQAGQSPGDDFLHNVDLAALPPGVKLDAESLVADVDQTLLFTDLEDFDDPNGFDAADLAVLNAFAAAAGFDDLDLAGTGFATGLGGAALTDFNPQFPPPDGDGPTGDFFATLGIDNYVGAQAVIPEPSSVVLFALGIGVLVVLRRRGTSQNLTAN